MSTVNLQHQRPCSVLEIRADGSQTIMAMRMREVMQRIQEVVAVPAAVATWVAATRVHDNVHHPADVACGSFLGVTCAALVFALATGGAAPRSAPLLEIGTEMTERRSEAGASAG